MIVLFYARICERPVGSVRMYAPPGPLAQPPGVGRCSSAVKPPGGLLEHRSLSTWPPAQGAEKSRTQNCAENFEVYNLGTVAQAENFLALGVVFDHATFDPGKVVRRRENRLLSELVIQPKKLRKMEG